MNDLMSRTSYAGLKPANKRASAAARGASRKTDTKPELTLRRVLWKHGCRYRKNVTTLPGKPDIVFLGARLVIFCDGDFWHGRDWDVRRSKLVLGHNANYWIAKIERNIERDRGTNRKLRESGWTVLRFWESEIKRDLERVVDSILDTLRASNPD